MLQFARRGKSLHAGLPALFRGPASSTSSPTDQGLSGQLAFVFEADALQASALVAGALTPGQRVLLSASLRENGSPDGLNEEYVDELFKTASQDGIVTK